MSTLKSVTGARSLVSALALAMTLAAQAAEPPTDATMIMVGSPPPANAQVTLANWLDWPYTTWSFQHIELIRQTTTVDRGDAPARAFNRKPVDLSGFTFADRSGRKRSLEQFLAEQHVDALLIWSNGKLRQEVYRNGQTERTRHIMFSVTKSFTGLVAEMLVAEGRLDPNKRVGDYLPELKGSAYEDAMLRNVLDMEVGVEYTEVYDDPTSTIYQFQYAAGARPVPPGVKAYPSLYEFLPSLQKKGEHGKDFHYVTANSEVLGWVIERVAGTGFARVFEERIYSKLGAERDAFYATDARGKAVAGGGLNLTARDALRLGVMMAQDGRFNDQQIVAPQVVRRIAAGGTPRPSSWGNEDGDLDHSYRSQWYIYHPTGTLSASGIYGQTIHISPKRQVVMVVQSSYPEADGAFFKVTDDFFESVADRLAAEG